MNRNLLSRPLTAVFDRRAGAEHSLSAKALRAFGRIVIALLALTAAVASVQLSLSEALALESSNFSVARLKYQGGGDWYNDPEVITNMLVEFEKRTGIPCARKEFVAAPDQPRIFEASLLYLTGHGNFKFTQGDIDNLRKYLLAGGLLYIDDDYGLDESARREIKKLFPESPMVEVPFDHPIYRCFYRFEKGVPKIHEHDGGAPKAFGVFYENRMVVLYTFNTNVSDGWADPKTHNDPPEIREEAFKMGTNIFYYALTSNSLELERPGAAATEEVNVR